jgi:uncharacterized protein YdhG (YjbR/CyaY superfamily)
VQAIAVLADLCAREGIWMDSRVENYLETIPPVRRSRFDSLHRLILDLYPQAVVDMKYRMPTYQVDDGWVAVANQKNYISLYTCGYHHIEKFKAKHPDIKTGKGCINFRDKDALPLADIEDIVKHAISSPKK